MNPHPTMLRYLRVCIFLLTLGILLPIMGCQKIFEHSPYSAELAAGYEGIKTEDNIARIKNSRRDEIKSFKIALISDTHYNLDDLASAVDAINQRTDIDFTILAGDMSDQGLEKEYMLLYDQLVKLNTPILTVIGNHDYLANAAIIYKKMFGDYNYSFTYKNYNFIFFDSNFWEKNGTPDFLWLESQLSIMEAPNSIIISHIAPFGDQFDQKSAEKYTSLTSKYRVPLSIHGHLHSYLFTKHYNDGTKYLLVPSIDKRELCIVSFDDGSIKVTREKF